METIEIKREDYEFIKMKTEARCLFCDLYVENECLVENSDDDEFECSAYGVNGEGVFKRVTL